MWVPGSGMKGLVNGAAFVLALAAGKAKSMKFRLAPLSVLLAALTIPVVPSSGRADEDDDDSTHADDVEGDEGDKSPKKTPPPAMPERIDICITSAVIAPTKGDGSPWDFGAKLTDDERKAATQLLVSAAKKAPPLIPAAMVAVFSRPAVQALDKPDVYGTVQLAPHGSYGQSSIKMSIAARGRPVREFQPNFGESVCFKGAPWSTDLRLRVDLTDADAINDDKIATVEVVNRNVLDAFAYGKPLHVHVGDQDTLQLSFVILNVTKADEAE